MVRSWLRQPSFGSLLAGVCLVGSACGGGAASGSQAPAPTGTPPPATAPGSQLPSAAVDGLDPAKLAGLQNYTFTSVNAYGSVSMTWAGRVHTPTDWVVTTNAPAVTTYDVDGHGFAVAIGRVENVALKSPEGVDHLFGEASVAEQLVGYTHVAGIRITRGASCTVAGASGVTFDLQSPNASTIDEVAQACVDRSNGALLSYRAGVSGGSAADATGLSGHRMTFTVTSIGSVGPIAVPTASS